MLDHNTQVTGALQETNVEVSALAARLVADGVAPAVVIAASVSSVSSSDRWERVRACWGRLSSAREAPGATEATFFDLASVTKPVIALTVARMVRAGELAYDETVGDLIPELRSTPAASATVERLLSHRAGLEGHRPLYAPLARGVPIDRTAGLLEAAMAQRPDCVGKPAPEHGFEPVYSDLGYLLVGEAVARRARRPLDEIVYERVLEPLGLGAGMGSSRQLRKLYANFEQIAAATEIVSWRGGVVQGVVHDENAWAMSEYGLSGHAGLFGRAEEVLRLGEAVLDIMSDRQPEFLTALELMPLVRPRHGGSLRAGFDGKSAHGSSTGNGWGPRSVGHLGFTGTSLWMDPEAALTGALLTNRVHPTRDSNRIRQARPLVYDAIAQWAAARRARK